MKINEWIDDKGFNILNLSEDEINFLLTSIDQNTKKGIRDFLLISVIIETQISCTNASDLDNDDVLLHWHRGRFRHHLRQKGKHEYLFKMSAHLYEKLFDYYNHDKDKLTAPLFTSIDTDGSKGRRLTPEEIFEITNNHVNKILYKSLLT